MKTKKIKTSHALAGGLIGGIALYFIFGYIFASAVSVSDAKRGTAVSPVSGTVNVFAEMESEILAPGSGILAESHVLEGKAVKKGDLLAKIDPGNLPFDIRSAEVEVERLARVASRGSPNLANLEELRTKAASAKILLQAGHYATAEYEALALKLKAMDDQVQKDIDDATAQLELKKNTLAQLRDSLDRLSLRSPITGVISEIKAFPGDLMSNGRPVARVVSSEVRLEAEVNQDDVSIIREGIFATVRFFAHPGSIYDAKVTQILPGSDKSTQRFRVHMKLVKDIPSLLPGMTGEVSFVAAEHKNALLVPRKALLGNNIFVLHGSSVDLRKVRLGFTSFVDAEILEGVREGETVVVEGQDILRDGERVRVSKRIGY